MVPSSKWFPQGLGPRADWYANFSAQFATVAILLGFTASDVTNVENDNLMMQFLVSARDQMQAVLDAARGYRKSITETAIGSPNPVWPDQFAGGPPLPQVPAGLFERLDNLVKRIRLSAGYTEEIGLLLGIVPAKSPETDPSEMQPDPKLSVEPGNVLIVEFTKGKADGIELQMMLDNSGNWENAGKYPKSPVTINVPQSVQALPRAVQIRARYLVGNNAVGQYSEIDTISTIP